mmetsp:Transcript_2584/g.10046  ORF Transcript_2584/g.10046 Transcript_2584/m.10046 type:complete len:305 (-) Transcript_2584:306-1220(-)
MDDLVFPHATSSKETTLGCGASRANTSISLAINSSDSSSMFASRMCFNATTRPFVRSSPRYTALYVPCPTFSSRRYVCKSLGLRHRRSRMATPAWRSIHAGQPESSCASSRSMRSSDAVSSDVPAFDDSPPRRRRCDDSCASSPLCSDDDDTDVTDSRLRLCAFLGWTWFSAGASTVSAHGAGALFATVDDALSWLDEVQDSSPHESPDAPSLAVRAWCADGGRSASFNLRDRRTWSPPVDAYLNGLAFLADVLVATRSRRRSASSTSRLDLANLSPRPLEAVTASVGSAANHRAPPRPEWLES